MKNIRRNGELKVQVWGISSLEVKNKGEKPLSGFFHTNTPPSMGILKTVHLDLSRREITDRFFGVSTFPSMGVLEAM